jgi:hypothetical protein
MQDTLLILQRQPPTRSGTTYSAAVQGPRLCFENADRPMRENPTPWFNVDVVPSFRVFKKLCRMQDALVLSS